MRAICDLHHVYSRELGSDWVGVFPKNTETPAIFLPLQMSSSVQMTTRSGRKLTVIKPKGRKLTMTFQKPFMRRQEELTETDYSSAIVMVSKPNDQELDVDAPIELPIPDIILAARKELDTIYILDSDDEDDADDSGDVIIISDSESKDDSEHEDEEIEDCNDEVEDDDDEVEDDDDEIEEGYDGDNDKEIETKKRRRERPDFKLHDDFMAAQSVWDRQRNDRQRHAWQMTQVKALSAECLGHITGRK